MPVPVVNDLSMSAPDSGDSGSANPDSGDSGSANPDSGDSGSANPDSGDSGSANPDSGDVGSADLDSGDVDSSAPDTNSNACLLNPCDANATCTDLGNGFSCACNAGYIGDGITCKSDGVTDCAADRDCIDKGPVPDLWPTFHPKITHQLYAGTTHVWSFVYQRQIVGQIGAVLSIGTKHFKISEVAGDTAPADSDCWRDFGEYVYYEPATGGDQYKCNLVVGRQYYFNVKNVSADDTSYQLKGIGTAP